MAKKTVVLVYGPAGAGKDTLVAAMMERIGKTSAEVKFADSIWDHLIVLDPIIHPGDDPMAPNMLRVSDLEPPKTPQYTRVEILAWRDEVKARYPEIRRLLQVYGSEVIRGLVSEDWWADEATERARELFLKEKRFIFLSDLRYENEADLFDQDSDLWGWDLHYVKIDRPNISLMPHQSEANYKAIEAFAKNSRPPEFINHVHNNKGVDDLRQLGYDLADDIMRIANL